MNNSELGAIVFGLISAASWGAGDFSGGMASKRTNVYGVIVVSQIIGLALLVVLAIAFNDPIPPIADWIWGGLAGLAGVMGIVSLYRALATTRMGMAAPISAVIAATIPVIFSMLTQGVPAVHKLIGFAIALVAVWLTSQTDAGGIRRNELFLPFMAGLGFGFFFILIDQANNVSAYWSLASARIASVTGMIIFIAVTKQAWRPTASRLPIISVAGILDTGGNLFFSLASQTGFLAEAVVLSSLYPAATVLLAGMILREKLHRVQVVGVVLALIAIALIAAP